MKMHVFIKKICRMFCQFKNNKRTKLKISRDGKSQIIIKENQTGREEKTS